MLAEASLLTTSTGMFSCLLINKDVLMSTDNNSHYFVNNLLPGEKVWVATEESIAQIDGFRIDIYEQSGPIEYEGMEEVFMPYEMRVLSNWTLKNCEEEVHIIALDYTSQDKCGQTKFICPTTNELRGLFDGFHCNQNQIINTHVFKTEEECTSFCRNYMQMRYTKERCDYILGILELIKDRVNKFREVCPELPF